MLPPVQEPRFVDHRASEVSHPRWASIHLMALLPVAERTLLRHSHSTSSEQGTDLRFALGGLY
jgi:hypothetical protein